MVTEFSPETHNATAPETAPDQEQETEILSPLPPELMLSTERLEKAAKESLRVIRANLNEETGLISAADTFVEGRCDYEHKYNEAWVRDIGFVALALLDGLHYQVESAGNRAEIESICRLILTKNLERFGTRPWSDAFAQRVEEVRDGAGEISFTRLTETPPPMHLQMSGDVTAWDHNQPESWADFLLAVAVAKEEGVMEYTPEQIGTVRTITEYLIRIQPWHFEGAAMWEGAPVRNPASRSNALAIAKALDRVGPLFADDQVLAEKIGQTVDRSMDFVREDIYQDYTTPIDHNGGMDLAMEVTLALPETERTHVPFDLYDTKASEDLGGNNLPGLIRFHGDYYYGSEKGEATWLMGDMVRAIGYLKESQRALTQGEAKRAKEFRSLGLLNVARFSAIREKYGYYPELFMQRDPAALEEQEKAQCIITESRGELVALQPNRNDLLWNHALAIHAGRMAALASPITMEGAGELLSQAG